MRAAFLHDIGKAIDREMQGTHLEIGVDFLRKHGESDRVVSAIAAHHMDIDWPSLEAMIVQAADAISAARPGARRDILESYVKRLEKLEDIADSFKGVSKAFALQAGREIRIMVESEKITDEEAVWLSKDIARRIENELEYPGQIKVTVIRETRAVEYAQVGRPPAWPARRRSANSASARWSSGSAPVCLRARRGSRRHRRRCARSIEPERNTLDVVTTDALDRRGALRPRATSRPTRSATRRWRSASATWRRWARRRVPRCCRSDCRRDPRRRRRRPARRSAGGRRHGSGRCSLGGNLTGSPGPLVVDLMAIGSVRRRRVLRRSGARPGDVVFVSGSIGAAAAGLASCRARAAGGATWRASAGAPACEARFLRPEPRVRLGMLLGRGRVASACIDLSDGLGDGVRQLGRPRAASASSIDAEAIPVDEETRRWFAGRGQDPVEAACAGGEDYELLFTVPPRRLRAFEAVRRRIGDLRCTPIGAVTADRAVRLAPGGP